MDASLYVLLGWDTHDQLLLVQDLLEERLQTAVSVVIYAHATARKPDWVERASNAIQWVNWTLEDGAINAPWVDADAHFFCIDRHVDIIDVLEALSNWLPQQEQSVTGIIGIVDAQKIQTVPEVKPWYEAIIHFSDVVCLDQVQKLKANWVEHYIEPFKKQCYPCLFLTMKDGRVPNPAIILDAGVRRMTQVFDQLQVDDEDEAMDQYEVDPYFKRLFSGCRAQVLPDVTRLSDE